MIIKNGYGDRMFFLFTMFNRWVDPDETTRFTQGAPKEGMTGAAQLTRYHTESSAGYTHTC
jgi:hypothetical protein